MKKLCLLWGIFILCLPAGQVYAQAGSTAEICTNGIDDDGDGYTDLNDPDCICNQPQVASLLPNHSFEGYTACPDYLSQMHLAAPWVQATVGNTSSATTDYFNTCGYLGASASVVPFPAGNGIAGIIVENGYKEYFGTCLPEALRAGTQYRLTFNVASVKVGPPGCDSDVSIYQPLALTLFGTVNCNALPAQNTTDAPTDDPNWKVLGSALYTPASQWGLVTLTFTPETDIGAIILGAPEVLPDGYPVWHPDDMVSCYPYFFFDNLILNSNLEFGLDIVKAGSLCSNDLELLAQPSQPLSSTAQYQWYKNGVAIIGATQNTYRVGQGSSAYGTYALRITDGAGCYIAYAEINSDINAPQAFTVPVCVPGTGAITVNTPAPFYSFDNGITWTDNHTAHNLLPGFYSVRIKNAEGCVSYPAYVEVTEFTLAAPAFAVRQPQDCANGGSITITTTAQQYSFDNGFTWQDGPMLSGITGGYFNLRIKNQDGCISLPVFVHINNFFSPAPDYRAVQPNCTTDGSLTIITHATQYSFDGGRTWQDSPTLENLGIGYYEMVVKDTNGCTSYPSFEFIAPAETLPNAPIASVQQPSSCLSQTGIITMVTPAAQYSFDNGLTWGAGNTSGPLPPGIYRVKIKNAAGCQSPDAVVTINTAPGMPQIPQLNVLQPGCNVRFGIITVTTVSALYSFDGGTTWSTQSFKDNLLPGTYLVSTKNNLGCESEVVEVVINAATITSPPLVSPLSYCENAFALPLTAVGDNLLWYTMQTGGTGSAVAPVPDTSVLGETVFYVSQTINGCESQRIPVEITISPMPPAPTVVSRLSYCQYSTTLPLTATGSNLLWYEVQTGGTPSSVAPIPQITLPGMKTFYVSQTINGCESIRAAIQVSVTGQPAPPGVVSPVVYNQGDEAQPLTAMGSSLTWYSSNNVVLALTPVPKTNAVGKVAYYVSQTINGCESSLTEILVEVLPLPLPFDYPKFFTPNEDGINDYWNIYDLRKDRTALIYIFDRYGKLITSVKPYEKGWDGTYNGHELPATDYWFMLLYTQNDLQHEFRSHFSLLR
ncbi:T9SS type B sorting domain-containing protein [Flavobacterium sp. Sd200]|uniref:T9SS type B sorting domain-containing protein n=1 Tax=Flavobacterium sp. Sd200 TaxID=2692211 RepID=UPI001368E575|nr:T9SS type B sorting domain-containing protein [Flavobacterium sp. Sd200]MXN92326.1 T9SS type B sorting domain-containing protein [Flavobacterium sp. Sd200]